MGQAPELTLVIPTFNERSNLAELIRRVDAVLTAVHWEIVIVDDDSRDGTAALAKSIAQSDPRIRCLRRVNRRGLAGACIEGILSSSAPYVGVMDADLQHDETILPQMLETLRRGNTDLVVGSRREVGGSADGGFSSARASLSRWAERAARLALKTELRDLMSGFFMLRREIVEAIAPRLYSSGFKILVDIVASSDRPLSIVEIGYAFRARAAGRSKLDAKVGLDFIGLILNKATRGVIPARFIFFALVGAVGVAVHLAVLRTLMLSLPTIPFNRAQTAATIVAMTSNFFVNNMVTYRDNRLGGLALVGGLALFFAVCGFGAVTNIAVASLLYDLRYAWWIAAFAGIVVGSVWNYALSTLFVWRSV